jgi:hypothetical protein
VGFYVAGHTIIKDPDFARFASEFGALLGGSGVIKRFGDVNPKKNKKIKD